MGTQEQLDGRFLDVVGGIVLLNTLVQYAECCSLGRHVEHKVLLQVQRTLCVALVLELVCKIYRLQYYEQ